MPLRKCGLVLRPLSKKRLRLVTRKKRVGPGYLVWK